MGLEAGLRETAESALLAMTGQPSLASLCRAAGVEGGNSILLEVLQSELEYTQSLPMSKVRRLNLVHARS